MLENDEKSVLDFIERNERATIKDIANGCAISTSKAHSCVAALLREEKIAEIGTSRGVYYTEVSEITAEQFDKLGTETKKITFRAQDDMQNVADEVKLLKNQIERIYVDFISLMAIFVAVFSLVSVNANIIAAVADKCICYIVRTTVIVNISVCFCMFIFVLLIRAIVLKPIKERKKTK